MDFVSRLRAEIAKLRKRRSELLSELHEVDRELQEYVAAMKVAVKFGETTSENAGDLIVFVPTASAFPLSSAQDERKTPVKDIILDILKQSYPDGMKAAAIRKRARDKFDTNVNPNYLTVALGRYKTEGKVRITKRRWYYVPPDQRQTLFTAMSDDTSD